jgi:thymidylate synthase
MNKLDKQYTDLLQDILDNGIEKKDRTGTGTLSVFGRQIRHKMSEGFPLLTTKKMYMRGVITELLWFLRGDTNIQSLVQNNCHIWDGDAYQAYLKECEKNRPLTKEEFINKIKTDDEFAKKWGDLGPIYGKQWRSWSGIDINKSKDGTPFGYKPKNIDQIANLINDLKKNPDSRRLMVNAWNVGEIDEMVLPPCHYGFQVYTRELSPKERIELAGGKIQEKYPALIEQSLRICDEREIPTRAISLMWNQRSVDTFLGLPFNIASYGLLLEILAKEVNMVPDELIGNLGDVHLYSNHIEQAKEQIGRELTIEERTSLYRKQQNLSDDVDFVGTDRDAHSIFDDYGITKRTREPFPLPTLKIKSAIGLYDFFEYINSADNTDFQLENYQSHPTIKAPLSN